MMPSVNMKWFQSLLDSEGRPIWTPSPAATLARVGQVNTRSEGYTGYDIAGFQAWEDNNIPTSGGYAQVLVADLPNGILVMTGTPIVNIHPEFEPTTLTAAISIRQYFASRCCTRTPPSRSRAPRTWHRRAGPGAEHAPLPPQARPRPREVAPSPLDVLVAELEALVGIDARAAMWAYDVAHEGQRATERCLLMLAPEFASATSRQSAPLARYEKAAHGVDLTAAPADFQVERRAGDQAAAIVKRAQQRRADQMSRIGLRIREHELTRSESKGEAGMGDVTYEDLVAREAEQSGRGWTT